MFRAEQNAVANPQKGLKRMLKYEGMHISYSALHTIVRPEISSNTAAYIEVELKIIKKIFNILWYITGKILKHLQYKM